jgi:hypothetical protein
MGRVVTKPNVVMEVEGSRPCGLTLVITSQDESECHHDPGQEFVRLSSHCHQELHKDMMKDSCDIYILSCIQTTLYEKTPQKRTKRLTSIQ